MHRKHENIKLSLFLDPHYFTQVLSATVAAVMRVHGRHESQETARFISLMDRFFDCLNGRSTEEAERKRKPDLRPYRSVVDERFQVSLSYVLHYQVIFQCIKKYVNVTIIIQSKS